MPSEAGSADYECLHCRLYCTAMFCTVDVGTYITFWSLSDWEVSTDQWTGSWPGGSQWNWSNILRIAGQVWSKQRADGLIQISDERLGTNSGALLVNWINFSWTRHLSDITPRDHYPSVSVWLSNLSSFIGFSGNVSNKSESRDTLQELTPDLPFQLMSFQSKNIRKKAE